MKRTRNIGTILLCAGLIFAFSPGLIGLIAGLAFSANVADATVFFGILTLPIGAVIVIIGIVLRAISQKKLIAAGQIASPKQFRNVDFWVLIALLSPLIVPAVMYLINSVMSYFS